MRDFLDVFLATVPTSLTTLFLDSLGPPSAPADLTLLWRKVPRLKHLWLEGYAVFGELALAQL